jgi:hypothetical protein
VRLEDLPDPDVGVVHSPLSSKDIGNSFCRPKVGVVPEGLGSSCQELGEGLQLLGRKVRRATGSRLGAKSSNASIGEPGLPIVNRLRSDPEPVGHLGLADSTSEQIVGPEASFLEGKGIAVLLSPASHEGGIDVPLDKET